MLDLQLISLYYRICHYYSTQLGWQVQRFSPNSLGGSITDEEIEAQMRDDPDWADLMDVDWSNAAIVYPQPKNAVSIRRCISCEA